MNDISIIEKTFIDRLTVQTELDMSLHEKYPHLRDNNPSGIDNNYMNYHQNPSYSWKVVVKKNITSFGHGQLYEVLSPSKLPVEKLVINIQVISG